MAAKQVKNAIFLKFIDDVFRLYGDWHGGRLGTIWFRGVADGFDLIPRLYWRGGTLEVENSIRNVFRLRGQALLSGHQPVNRWEWYFLMRHHGCPTRLLDWSENALVALYFALRDAQKHKRAAIIWALNPMKLNEASVGVERMLTPADDSPLLDKDSVDAEIEKYLPAVEGAELPKLPIAILPPHISPRIVAQRGCFTIHGADRNGISMLAKGRDDTLRRIKINGAIEECSVALRCLGMSEDLLFPDLDGLARGLDSDYAGHFSD